MLPGGWRKRYAHQQRWREAPMPPYMFLLIPTYTVLFSSVW